MSKRTWALIFLLAFVLAALLFWLVRPLPPAEPTVTIPPPPPTVASTATATATLAAVATVTVTKTATQTPQSTEISQITPVHTPTAAPTIVVTPTPDLLGHHLVQPKDTMYDIGLWWYRGRYFAWGRDVWEPICDANPHIANCRLIYPGDVLAIPRLP